MLYCWAERLWMSWYNDNTYVEKESTSSESKWSSICFRGQLNCDDLNRISFSSSIQSRAEVREELAEIYPIQCFWRRDFSFNSMLVQRISQWNLLNNRKDASSLFVNVSYYPSINRSTTNSERWSTAETSAWKIRQRPFVAPLMERSHSANENLEEKVSVAIIGHRSKWFWNWFVIFTWILRLAFTD